MQCFHTHHPIWVPQACDVDRRGLSPYYMTQLVICKPGSADSNGYCSFYWALLLQEKVGPWTFVLFAWKLSYLQHQEGSTCKRGARLPGPSAFLPFCRPFTGCRSSLFVMSSLLQHILLLLGFIFSVPPIKSILDVQRLYFYKYDTQKEERNRVGFVQNLVCSPPASTG